MEVKLERLVDEILATGSKLRLPLPDDAWLFLPSLKQTCNLAGVKYDINNFANVVEFIEREKGISSGLSKRSLYTLHTIGLGRRAAKKFSKFFGRVLRAPTTGVGPMLPDDLSELAKTQKNVVIWISSVEGFSKANPMEYYDSVIEFIRQRCQDEMEARKAIIDSPSEADKHIYMLWKKSSLLTDGDCQVLADVNRGVLSGGAFIPTVAFFKAYLAAKLDFYFSAIARFDASLIRYAMNQEPSLAKRYPEWRESGWFDGWMPRVNNDDISTPFANMLNSWRKWLAKLHNEYEPLSWAFMASHITLLNDQINESGYTPKEKREDILSDWRNGEQLPSYAALVAFVRSLFRGEQSEIRHSAPAS